MIGQISSCKLTDGERFRGGEPASEINNLTRAWLRLMAPERERKIERQHLGGGVVYGLVVVHGNKLAGKADNVPLTCKPRQPLLPLSPAYLRSAHSSSSRAGATGSIVQVHPRRGGPSLCSNMSPEKGKERKKGVFSSFLRTHSLG